VYAAAAPAPSRARDCAPADAASLQAVKLEPTSLFALNNLGTLRLLAGKVQEGLEELRKIDFEASGCRESRWLSAPLGMRRSRSRHWMS
jgi:Flp pilus assembly protein TadD